MKNPQTEESNESKVIILTGAGGNLGRAIAHRLLLDGFQCVLAGRTELTLRRTVETAGNNSVRARTVVCDISRQEDRIRLVSAASHYGNIFALINNAGVALGRPLLEVPIEDWHQSLNVNLEAAFFLSQKVIEYMRGQQEGRIVNIASIRGVKALDNSDYGSRAPQSTPGNRGPMRDPAYAASKGGLIQLTRELAAAVGRWGITVNAISPGVVPIPSNEHQRRSPRTGNHDTPPTRPGLGDRVNPEILRRISSRIPLGRLGKVQEIAGPISFLLSPDATYISGTNLIVDGGWHIW